MNYYGVGDIIKHHSVYSKGLYNFSCLTKPRTLRSPHVRESGFQNPGKFFWWNPDAWDLESESN